VAEWAAGQPGYFGDKKKNLLLCQELNDSLVIQQTDMAMSKPQHLGSHHDTGRLRICMPHMSFAKHLICKTLATPIPPLNIHETLRLINTCKEYLS